MANNIVLKKSSVPGKVPQAGDLAYGELAINYADGKLYYKKSDNTISAISGDGGGTSSPLVSISDTAPASPTAGQLWWDSTQGQLYLYYSDGTSSQWVQAAIGTVGPIGPAGEGSGSSGGFEQQFLLMGA